MTSIDLTALPVSAVPAAFDRGHLYSPTLDLTTRRHDDMLVRRRNTGGHWYP